METKDQNIAPMPRPNFEGMKDKALKAYLTQNSVYVSPDDQTGTREELLVTVGLVFDRKAEDFIGAKAEADKLNLAVDETNAILQKFPKSPNGMTPDDVKASPAFKTASQNFDRAFGALRKFNGTYTKRFADELRHERDARRAARLAIVS